jgi:2-polyprenyl-3-methyl-5-hydroxy-6-metoxy-1,4-benzoquinol methylase
MSLADGVHSYALCVFPRLRTDELMDDPALPAAEHDHALRGLARINALSRAWAPIARAMHPLSKERELSVLDVATGSADVPLALATRFRNARWYGCDVSTHALAVAQARADAASVKWEGFQHDIVAEPLRAQFDVVLCSLFLHHLEPQDVKRALAHMAQATRRMLIVHDLRRSVTGLALAHAVPRVLTRSRVVHVDAVKSVRAAYTRDELRGLAADAGLAGVRIAATFPQRMLLTWMPGGAP